MKKSFWLGMGVLLLLVGGALVWRYFTPSGAVAQAGALGSVPNTNNLTAAVAEPLKLAGIGGYSLSTVDLGDGPVPVVRIPLDTWGGYAALFAANGSILPNKDSYFYKNYKFAVELVREENAQAQLDGYASGRYPFIWSAMDGIPLLLYALKGDKRVVPQAIALFDWSIGGDGIVVRDYIRKPQELKGKTILTSSPTPYSFFLLWYLAQLDISPLDVKIVHVGDGPEALATFKNNPGVAAWVTWTPFLTNVVDQGSPDYIKGTRLLITSKDANQLIADMLIARNDIVKEKPEIIEGLVAGIIAGTDMLKTNPTQAYKTMAEFYKLPGGVTEAKEYLEEVHLANLPESLMFFDSKNPIGAFKIFLLAQEYYKMIGLISSDSDYEVERVLGLSGLEKARAKGIFSKQVNQVQNSFNRDVSLDINDLENQRVVLSNDIKLYFEAQKLDFDINSTSEEIRTNLRMLGKVADQMGFLGTTVVKLIGHLDTTRLEDFKSQGPQAFVEASAQAKLISKRRAEFVKKVLVDKFKLDGERIITQGRGWDQPVNETDPSANRRVEVQFLSFE